MQNNRLNIQFVGYGNMGSSLGSLVKQQCEELHISLRMGIQTQNTNTDYIGDNADIVFTCVKPAQYNNISLDRYNHNAVCVSIMNGITTAKLDHFNKIIRTMPNLLGEVGEGITGWYQQGSIDTAIQDFIQRLFTQSGVIVALDNEIDFSVFTAFAGCGPAIVAYIEQYCHDTVYRSFVYESLRNVGVMLGFSIEQSSIMVEKIRHGLPKYLNKYQISHADMIQRVSAGDKGSSTYHIIDSFAKNNLDALLTSQDISLQDILYTGIWAGKLQSDTITKQYSS